MGNITARDLTAGDVLLYNGNGFVSDAICFFDGTSYSHASLFLGGDSVGEAIAEGLCKRTIQKSFKDANYVLARRLIPGPSDKTPVITVADHYLQQGNRYGFEQLLLLAILTLTRRLKENKYLAWLVRKVLDNAADYLMDHSDRQPMICSEFVYLCYDEAVQGENDPYNLRINTYPVADVVALDIRTLGAPAARQRPGGGGAQESLLAWAVRSRGQMLVTGVPITVAGREQERKPGKDDTRLSRMSLDEIIEAYLADVKKPIKAEVAAATSKTPEVLASIERFGGAFREGAAKRLAAVKGPRKPEVGRLPAMGGGGQYLLQHFKKTVANWVTPGDLLKCGNLNDVGTIRP